MASVRHRRVAMVAVSKVARGKALVVKLRTQAGVRDPEALAAWAGRTKRLRKAGMSAKAAAILANRPGGMNGGRTTDAPEALRPATAEDRKRLRIPPAWTDVKVSPDTTAALQAVGRDSKGREQRVYSSEHHEKQAAAKFARIGALHERLPEIDARLSRDAKTDDTALAALLIRRMGLRPGSDSDTGAEKKAYGATNLKASHITTDGKTVRARFTGKKGVDLDLSIEDPELARLLAGRKRGKSGDDRLLSTDERKLRGYMKEVAPGVKPKDLRTYLGTATAMRLVADTPVPKTKKEYQSRRREVGKRVSDLLGNTPTIALASYVAPSVFGAWDSALISGK